MKTSESISNISAALAKFQKEVKQPKKDTNNPFFNKKYVPLEGVVAVITDPLTNNGLSYIQSTGSEGESVTVTTLLMHTSGEFIESDPLKLPGHQLQKGGSKDFNPQGIGSAITYGRRYSLTALLGIASEEDDDGNSGSSNPNTSEGYAPTTPSGEHNSSSRTPQGQQGNTNLISTPQINLTSKLKKEKGISDTDFNRMVTEISNGKTDIKELTKKQASEFIDLLSNYTVVEKDPFAGEGKPIDISDDDLPF